MAKTRNQYSKEYKELYEIAKKRYLTEEISLTQLGKELGIDRGRLSNNLKKDGITIINRQNLPRMNQDFFEQIDTEEKAYWLGFMYADGWVEKDGTGIELSLKADDFQHLEKMKKSLDFTNKNLFKDEIRCRLSFRNKKMHDDLIKQGCIPQKSLILTFPSEKQVPKKLLSHFIRGYIDGDGSIMIGKNHKNEYVKPRLNVLGTKNFLETLIQITQWRQMTIQKLSNTYCVEWGGFYVEEYLDWLYKDANIYLDRKYKKYREIKNVLICRSKK